jgi:hypothetical protein
MCMQYVCYRQLSLHYITCLNIACTSILYICIQYSCVSLHHWLPLQFPHLITHTLHMAAHMCTQNFPLQGVGAECEAIYNFVFDFKNYFQKSFWACNCNITLVATHPDTTLTGTSQVYTYRQHTATDWNEMRQACWHVVIAQGTGIDPWWWSEDWPKHVGSFNLILNTHHRHF